MKFIKLTRVLDPYEIRVGYYGTTYVPSPYVPIGQVYGTTSSGYATGGTSPVSTTGFLQGLGSLVGLGSSGISSGVVSQLNQQQAQLSQSQQMAQQRAQGQVGQIITYNPATASTYATLPNPPPSEQELYVPVESINYMVGVKDLNYKTSLFIINKEEPFCIKESPEQIMKIMHETEFNAKMDDILK